MGIENIAINQATANKVLKDNKVTWKNKLAAFMLTSVSEEDTVERETTNFRIEKFGDVADYYRRVSYENCNDELKSVLNRMYNGTFGENMFVFRESYAPLPGKDASKTFCMLTLAHMISKLTNNSKDYPEDVIEELKYFLSEINKKAQEIKSIDDATMEEYINNVKAVFNADMVVSKGNYNRLEYVKNIEPIIANFFEHPEKLEKQDVDKTKYENRDIYEGQIEIGDIYVKYNEFLEIINTNYMGSNGKNAEGVALYLVNLIKLKDQQDREEVKRVANNKIPYEDFFGREHIFDPNDPDLVWNHKK